MRSRKLRFLGETYGFDCRLDRSGRRKGAVAGLLGQGPSELLLEARSCVVASAAVPARGSPTEISTWVSSGKTCTTRNVLVSPRSRRTAGGRHMGRPVRALGRPQSGWAAATRSVSQRSRSTTGSAHVCRPVQTLCQPQPEVLSFPTERLKYPWLNK